MTTKEREILLRRVEDALPRAVLTANRARTQARVAEGHEPWEKVVELEQVAQDLEVRVRGLRRLRRRLEARIEALELIA